MSSPNNYSVLNFYPEYTKSHETLIQFQLQAFRRYAPFYLCRRALNALNIPLAAIIPINLDDFILDELEFSFKPSPRYEYLLMRLHNFTPRLIHAWSGGSAASALAIAKVLKIPLVATLDNALVTESDQRLRRGDADQRQYFFWRKSLHREVALFIVDAVYMFERLLEQGVPKEKIVIHHSKSQGPETEKEFVVATAQYERLEEIYSKVAHADYSAS